MSKDIIKVRRDSQNRESEAWKRLLELIDKAAEDCRTMFHPGKELGGEIWKDIRSLPTEISKLKNLEHLMLYGSNLQRLPQEIGQLKSLKEFTPYTSYGLRWFPYEILECINLRSSTVSTRALFGNRKNKKPFPNLEKNPVDYFGGNKCSFCKTNETEKRFEQYWITTRVGTDTLPLLVIVCSDDCFSKLEKSDENNLITPHKGEIIKKEK